MFFIYMILACYEKQMKPYLNIMYNMLRSPDSPVVLDEWSYDPWSQSISIQNDSLNYRKSNKL